MSNPNKGLSDQFGNILNQFQDSLLHPPVTILSALHSNANINSEKRFKIYQYAYEARLVEILASDYPKLKILLDTELGENAFDTMAEAYLAKYPSRYPNVYYFSQHLAQFLSETKPYQAHSYLKEMADFEWIMGEVQHTTDIPSIEPNALLSVPSEMFGEIKVTFTGSMQLVSYHWNVPQIWGILEHRDSDSNSDTSKTTPHEITHSKNNEIDQNTESAKNNNPKIYPDLTDSAIAEDWLMYRHERQIFYRSISIIDALTIKLMQNNASFAELCEALCEHMEEDKVPEFAISHLQQWLAWGQVSNIDLE